MQQESKIAANQNKQIRFAAYLMMGSTLLSRVIGFVREMVLAGTVGASGATDVYYASFTVPDFLNSLMAAGALSISFVPILSGYVSKGETGNDVFRSISTWMTGLLLILVVLCSVFAEHLATWIAPGFNIEQITLMAKLLRIILPAQLFFYWGGLAIAVQYTHGRFLFPALAPLLYNIGIISFGLLFHQNHGVVGFSIGVLAGVAISHGALQWWGIKKLGYIARPLFRMTPEIKKVFKQYIWITLPIMLGFSLVAGDEWFTKYFGSQMEAGAVSWLTYARRAMQVPVAVVAQAAGIASFPAMARLWAKQDYLAYGKTILVEVQRLWAVAPLAAIVFGFQATPICHILFVRGKFTVLDAASTGGALEFASIGIFFWAVQIILARGFYACQKTWLPSLVGTLCTLFTLPLYWSLGAQLGFKGLALAGSLGIGVYAISLWILLARHLKRYAPEIDYGDFNKFAVRWTIYLLGSAIFCAGIKHWGIYQGTFATALIEVGLCGLTLFGLGFALLRLWLVKYTDGEPLF